MPIPSDLKDRVAALERNAPHVHPAIHHLFALLPEPGSEFDAEQRQEFLRATRGLFTMVYGISDHIVIQAALGDQQTAPGKT